MRWIFVAVLLLAASAAPAQADISRHTCEHYFGDSENAPPEARDLLKPGSDAALRICSIFGDPDSRYFKYVSAPLLSSLRVCQISEERLFKHEAGWQSYPPPGETYHGRPTVFMMISEGNCPRQDDPRYIIADRVSGGIFVTAVRFLEKLSSRDDQDALFSDVDPAVRSGATFKEFESAVRNGKELKLTRVALGSLKWGVPMHYSLDLEGSPTNFALLFDVVDGRLVVGGIGTFVY